MRKLPDNYECTGCHSCFNICPKQCIEMVADKNGFLYPRTDMSRCINCGACEKRCPVLSERKLNPKGEAFGCVNKNKDIQKLSSSGGVFNLIAEYIIENGGIVFGAVFDEELNVKHIEACCKDELGKMRGSKYVQSEIGYTYKKAKEHLENGKMVFFTGTPCQIGGLVAFLKKDYDNLITQDIICHGVPSPMVWKRYVEHIKTKFGIDENIRVNFRDKANGWKNYSLVFQAGSKIHRIPASENNYMKAFIDNLCLRNSCYNCKYKSLERESDITLADFWGVESVAPDLYDFNGTSLMFVNSEKGKKILNEIIDGISLKKVDINTAVQRNKSAYIAASKNKNRDDFLNAVRLTGFEKATKKYVKKKTLKTILRKIKNKIKTIMNQNNN